MKSIILILLLGLYSGFANAQEAITLDEAHGAFNIFKNSGIPFLILEEGCYPRAYFESILLAELGIEHLQLKFKGNGLGVVSDHSLGSSPLITWFEHVVTAVNVRTGKSTRLYVLDPALASGPMTLTAYKKQITRHRLAVIKTERFHFSVTEKDSEIFGAELKSLHYAQRQYKDGVDHKLILNEIHQWPQYTHRVDSNNGD